MFNDSKGRMHRLMRAAMPVTPPPPRHLCSNPGRRLSLLSALALLLGALLLFDAAPAEAQAPRLLWKATLTVQDVTVSGGNRGCFTDPNAQNPNYVPASERCTNTAVLSEDEFTLGGQTYTIQTLTYTPSDKALNLEINGPRNDSALALYSLFVLQAGYPNFRFDTMRYETGSGGVDYYGLVSENTGISWSAGDTVEVWIGRNTSVPAQAKVSGLAAPPGDSDEELALSWTNPRGVSSLTHTLHVRWRERGTSAWQSADDVPFGNRFTETEGTGSLGGKANPFVTRFEVTGLTPSTTYDVRVALFDKSTRQFVWVDAAGTTLKKVSNLVSSNIHGFEQLRVFWRNPPGITTSTHAVHVRWREEGTSAWQSAEDIFFWVGSIGTTYTITGLKSGFRYDVGVGLFDKTARQTAWVDYKLLNPSDQSTTPLLRVSNLIAAPDLDKLTLSWTNPPGLHSETAFYIQWREQGTSAWQPNIPGRQIPSGSTTYELTGLTGGKTYDVRVAVYPSGELFWSEPATGTPLTSLSLSASPTTVREGERVTVTATLRAALSEDVSIPVVAAGRAFDITIPAGQASGTREFTAPQVDEGDLEQFQIAIDWWRMPKSLPAVPKYSQSITGVTVLDENADPHRVSVSDASGTEMANGYPRMCFALTLNRAASHRIWVGYRTENGTAVAGQDYAGVIGSPVIPFEPGETYKRQCIRILDDNVEDSGETFSVVLVNPHGAILGRARGTGTIYNHEPTSLSSLTAEGAPAADGPFAALDIGTFAPATTAYAATVPHGTTHARLTPKSLNRYLTITTGLDGKGKTQVPFGGGTGPAVALAVGENVLVVKTLLASGQRQTYRVTITREESQAPTVASAISDATIVNTSGTKRVSLSGVFTDADGDSLTITAVSSSTSVATVSVSADYSSLTLTAKARGTTTITVTAADGNGGSVEDSFTVTVKAAPVVASAIADVSELAVEATYKVSLSGVFSDADGDSLTVTAGSSNDAVATVSVAADQSGLTLTGKGAGTATITVTARDSDGNSVSDAFDVTVVKVNSAPTVASAISDATIINESGTKRVSLSGVFMDADGDSLTITATTSTDGVATASVAADYSSLTVTAKSRGTATITVTAKDGNGGSVKDSFTVTVKAAPAVASAIADISELAAGASQQVSLAGVFTDADGDALTLSAVSSSSAVVTVLAQLDPVTGSATAITVTGVSSGTATVTVTARDTDGNSVNDAFDVTVPVVEEQQAVELPGPVVSLAVTASAEDSVTVSWSAPDTGGAPQGYIVHIKRKGGGYQDTRRPGADRTQVSFKNMEPGRTYEVWVRAQNETGKGERVSASITLPESEEPEDTPPAVLPGPVAGLELTADGNTLTVSWSAPESGGAPDGYIVHVSPEDGGKGRTKTPKAMKTQVTFKNLEAGRTYAVWVRAENEAGKGERVHASITLPEEENGQ